MSNAIYPDLPGLKPSVKVAPRFSTKIQSAISGRETRAAFMAYPLWSIDIGYEFLRSSGEYPELDTIAGFFLARRGAFESFLFEVPNDNACSNMPFAVGDGVRTEYQLTRTRGAGGFGRMEPVENVKTISTIMVGSAPVAYGIDPTGVVTLSSPPPVGVAVSWTGSYYYRCRFADDSADFERFMQDLWTLGKIRLIGAPGNRV